MSWTSPVRLGGPPTHRRHRRSIRPRNRSEEPMDFRSSPSRCPIRLPVIPWEDRATVRPSTVCSRRSSCSRPRPGRGVQSGCRRVRCGIGRPLFFADRHRLAGSRRQHRFWNVLFQGMWLPFLESDWRTSPGWEPMYGSDHRLGHDHGGSRAAVHHHLTVFVVAADSSTSCNVDPGWRESRGFEATVRVVCYAQTATARRSRSAVAAPSSGSIWTVVLYTVGSVHWLTGRARPRPWSDHPSSR